MTERSEVVAQLPPPLLYLDASAVLRANGSGPLVPKPVPESFSGEIEGWQGQGLGSSSER
ncbi:MAG: hypothetical protein GY856_05120 [bacterium]|nr:hypothetical protein [bacterium]